MTNQASHQKALAAYAQRLHSMATSEVEQIAKNPKETAERRAFAWRELKWRQQNEPQIARTLLPPDDDILITIGARPDGTLAVRQFPSQARAAEAGFPWAGLPSRTLPPADTETAITKWGRMTRYYDPDNLRRIANDLDEDPALRIAALRVISRQGLKIVLNQTSQNPTPLPPEGLPW